MERIRVPGDQSASIVRAAPARPPTMVFLPGLCSNANAYLQGFPEAARQAGGVVAIEGDQDCRGAPGFHSFTWDAAKQHARIEAALAAAGLEAIPPEGLTVVGYSQGASIAEQLAARWPERYARVVLIGAPSEPFAGHFRGARAVVTMSCSLDVPFKMRPAAKAIDALGVPATYVEMPGCTHGNLANAEVVFGEVFRWLEEHGRSGPERAAVPLVGRVEEG